MMMNDWMAERPVHQWQGQAPQSNPQPNWAGSQLGQLAPHVPSGQFMQNHPDWQRPQMPERPNLFQPGQFQQRNWQPQGAGPYGGFMPGQGGWGQQQFNPGGWLAQLAGRWA